MKQILYLLFVLLFVCTHVQAKAVKLGRSSNIIRSYQSVVNVGSDIKISEPSKECDANCLECDKTTGNCLLCNENRYISGKLCLICPEKNYCDGKTAIPNCMGVSCLSGSIPEATDTGCCCRTLGCDGVSCKSGYTAIENPTGCCCV